MKRLAILKNQLSNKGKILVDNPNGNKAIKIVTIDSGLNPLSEELCSELYEVLLNLDKESETKVIILTGNGKAFAAGADIKFFTKLEYNDMRNKFFLSYLEYISYNITKPIIAAVNGIAYGGGFELALCCDMIIASDKSKFAFPELKLGLFPGAGGTQRIAKLMGPNKAMEYILTTKDIPLSELKSFGVINHIVPHDELISYTVKIAESISKFSLMAIFAAKRSVKLSQETNLFAGLRIERNLFDSVYSTQDKKIGVNSFINKKNPTFVDK